MSALDIAIKEIPLNRAVKTARFFEVKDMREVNFDNYQDQSFIDYIDSLPEPKQYEWEKNIRGLIIEENRLCYLTFMGRIEFRRKMIDLYPIPQDSWFLCFEDQNGKGIKEPLNCIDC